jgi:hypothetical protein
MPITKSIGEYDQTADIMLEMVTPFLEKSYVNIIGGCCGTTDTHIQKLLNVSNFNHEYCQNPICYSLKRARTIVYSARKIL